MQQVIDVHFWDDHRVFSMNISDVDGVVAVLYVGHGHKSL